LKTEYLNKDCLQGDSVEREEYAGALSTYTQEAESSPEGVQRATGKPSARARRRGILQVKGKDCWVYLISKLTNIHYRLRYCFD